MILSAACFIVSFYVNLGIRSVNFAIWRLKEDFLL